MIISNNKYAAYTIFQSFGPQKHTLQDWPADLSSVSLASASRHILTIRPCFWTTDMRSRRGSLANGSYMGKVAHCWGLINFDSGFEHVFFYMAVSGNKIKSWWEKPSETPIPRRWTAPWRAKLVAVTPQPSWVSVRTAEFDVFSCILEVLFLTPKNHNRIVLQRLHLGPEMCETAEAWTLQIFHPGGRSPKLQAQCEGAPPVRFGDETMTITMMIHEWWW